jgi:hypothetical protein
VEHSEEVVRPERFELPTFWFVARRSIQLSYERTVATKISTYRRASQNSNAQPNRRSSGLLVSAAGGLYPAELRAHRCAQNSTMPNPTRLYRLRKIPKRCDSETRPGRGEQSLFLFRITERTTERFLTPFGTTINGTLEDTFSATVEGCRSGFYRSAAAIAITSCRPCIIAANPGRSSDWGPSESARSGHG